MPRLLGRRPARGCGPTAASRPVAAWSLTHPEPSAAMLTREELREVALGNKDRQGLSWPQVGQAIGRSPVYAAALVYGYGQATAEEADGLVRALSLPPEARAALMKPPHREPAQPWPPTDPF